MLIGMTSSFLVQTEHAVRMTAHVMMGTESHKGSSARTSQGANVIPVVMDAIDAGRSLKSLAHSRSL
jgi:hypothetical protein